MTATQREDSEYTTYAQLYKNIEAVQTAIGAGLEGAGG